VESGQRGCVITGKEEYLPPYPAVVQAVDQQILRLRN
jgi:CHASE3 domain sensor protein